MTVSIRQPEPVPEAVGFYIDTYELLWTFVSHPQPEWVVHALVQTNAFLQD